MPRLMIAVITAVLLTAAPVCAEEAPGRRVMIGTGVQTVPRFPGADGNQAAFLPLFDTWREGEQIPVESPDEAFGSALIGSRSGTALPKGGQQTTSPACPRSALGLRPGSSPKPSLFRNFGCALNCGKGSARTRR
jgi:hypothetical protein